ncbi:MAG TPA: ABC transporter substrate-binding protein, partial [Acidimicrobiales bacterium]|nr:ABC transporter substrate-binding protein [Acidimicrobiales bacterium]
MAGRIRLSAVVLVLLLALSACGSSKKTTSATTGGGSLFSKLPSAIQSSKEIKVGSDIEYAPIEFYKEGTQELQGLDSDLAQAMGQKLGVKFTFVNDTDFAGIISALQAGRFDIIMSAMNDTAERRKKGADFIDYFTAGTSIIVQKGNPKGIKTPDDLCGQTVAVQKGTVQDTDILTPQVAKCKSGPKPLNVLRFEKDTDALQQVKNGRAVANLEDFPVAAYNAKTSGGGNDFTAVDVPGIGPGSYGIAVLKTNTQLRDALQAALKAVIA